MKLPTPARRLRRDALTLALTPALALSLALPGAAALAQSTPIGEPDYTWFVRETFKPPGGFDSDIGTRMVQSGSQVGGTVLRVHSMGDARTGFPALAMAAGYDDGRTFWTQVVAPISALSPGRDVLGASSTIHIAQSFRKDSPDARLSFSFTGGRLQLMDWGAHYGRTAHTLVAEARFDVFVFDHVHQEVVWSEAQSALLTQDRRDPDDHNDNLWRLTRTQAGGPTASGMAPWVWQCDACGQGAYGFATATLQVPYEGVIDLSRITTGQEFTVSFTLATTAIDYLQGETAALAYARDPVSGDGGIGYAFAGLTPTDRPLLPAVPEPRGWALMAAGLGALLALRRRVRAVF